MTIRFVSQNKRYATCKCPFHNDKHASAVVYKNDMRFVCFTCHVSMPFAEVLKKLGEDPDNFTFEASDFIMPDLLEDNFTFSRPTSRALEYLNNRQVDVSLLPHYIASPKNDNGIGFLFKTMLGTPFGMQVRLFPENVKTKNIRYVLQGKRSEMFGYFPEFMRGGYNQLFAFEKAFGMLRAQQISDKYNLGIAAICTAGSHIQSSLLGLVGINTVFFFDNDNAGIHAGQYVKGRGFRVIIPKYPVDDMTEVDLLDLLRKVGSV